MFPTGGAEACVFWGKFRTEDSRCLPLVAHCLDVAVVFRALCELDAIRRSLRCAAGAPVTEQQLDRLAVLAMLHDVGKANLGFQLKVFGSKMPKAGHIRELGPLLDPYALDEQLHMAFLESLPPGMAAWFDDEQIAYSYFLAAFSHHGTPLQFKGQRSAVYWDARDRWWRRGGRWDPMAAIAEISRWAQIAFPGAFEPGGSKLPSAPRFHHRFAGLLMLADWLGSHPAWFPVEQVDAGQRLRHARQVAPRLLRAVGLDVVGVRQVASRAPHHFHQRFGFAPRPVQEAIDDLDPELTTAHLVIAESETGSGKTEAALNWWFKLFRAGKVDGLFFALPTRVAAREIYGRVWRTMQRWFPDPPTRPVTLLAVPGYAQVDGVSPDQVLPAEDAANIWQDDEVLLNRQRQWAGERPKRFLAATVAVGTIDQALLSGVQTTHAHLRSVCLDRSLLVVDEVHASDVYMSRLLERVLEHHLAVGGYAMLLSATLGARARHRYAAVAGGAASLPEAQITERVPYPAITLADGVPRAVQGASREEKRVRFDLVPLAFRPEALVESVVEALGCGARVVVVMNTVARANALLRAFESCDHVDPAWLFSCEGVVCPHHGRFAPEDRSLLDSRVSERLGPGGAEGPLLLVGTQTLEQSLDIDADLLVSDLAPADVLLQRVGRLHRHRRGRPPGYGPPARCIVLVPAGDLTEALDDRGNVVDTYRRLGYGSVYEDLRSLELTRRFLEQHPEISIPRDNRRLVEAVTHPQHLASLQGNRWQRHTEHIEGGELARSVAAGHVVAIFDKYFGTFEFNEHGGSVTVRLGMRNLQLPLDRPIISPFGRTLREVVIPGHMSPAEPTDRVSVEQECHGITILRCGGRRYRYSRYGLEELRESADGSSATDGDL